MTEEARSEENVGPPRVHVVLVGVLVLLFMPGRFRAPSPSGGRP
ncbi:hypothetical protein [Nocardiopsis chromatogenes]|nr:hypothetical protein [Nocardiopsis chromatogenes]